MSDDEWDIYIVSKQLPSNYSLITKRGRVIFQGRSLGSSTSIKWCKGGSSAIRHITAVCHLIRGNEKNAASQRQHSWQTWSHIKQTRSGGHLKKWSAIFKNERSRKSREVWEASSDPDTKEPWQPNVTQDSESDALPSRILLRQLA